MRVALPPRAPVLAFAFLALTMILPAPGITVAEAQEFELLWHRYLPDPIYTTVGASDEGGALAGNYLNSPVQAEHYDLWGSGTPDWAHPGTEFYVDVSRWSTVLAGLDCNPADSSVTVKRWSYDSPTPLWSYRIHPCRPLTGEGWSAGKGIQVSDDGSTIAVIVNMYGPGGLDGRLFVFAPDAPAPAIDYPLPDGSTASALAATYDGAFIAIYAWPTIYVYDRGAGQLRWSGSAGSGNDAIAISGDGRYLAWGWYSFTLREWNGASYQQIWSATYGGTYLLTECALTLDGEMLALAWYKNTTFDDTLIELYKLPGVTPIWTYSYAAELRAAGGSVVPDADGRNPTDVPSEMLFAGDDLLAVASWGGTFPEIHVFERAQPTPLLVYDTPGTMFDIDIVPAPEATYLTVCGKHVHAGQSGRGGDLYAFAAIGGLGIEDEAGAVSAALRLRSEPNPCRDRTTLRYRLDAPGPARLTVHDLQGRAIATLVDGSLERGEHSATWTGRDARGRRVPAGVYLLRLATAGGARTPARLVLLETR